MREHEGTYKGFDNILYKQLEDYHIRILPNGGGTYDKENIIDNIHINNIYGQCYSSLFFLNNIHQMI